jgi:hypothetical protein
MSNFHGFEIVPQSVGQLSWTVQAQLPTVGEMEQLKSLLNYSGRQEDLEERNVLFMEDGGSVYLKKMFERVA